VSERYYIQIYAYDGGRKYVVTTRKLKTRVGNMEDLIEELNVHTDFSFLRKCKSKQENQNE